MAAIRGAVSTLLLSPLISMLLISLRDNTANDYCIITILLHPVAPNPSLRCTFLDDLFNSNLSAKHEASAPAQNFKCIRAKGFGAHVQYTA
jgi:hypothetical protein